MNGNFGAAFGRVCSIHDNQALSVSLHSQNAAHRPQQTADGECELAELQY